MTFTVGNAQSTLQVNIKDCREKNSFKYLSEFKLFRNDSLIKTIEPKHERKQKIKNLEYGSYRVEYETIFRKTESIRVELIEKKKYNVDLCLDYIDYKDVSYKPIIDLLENGKSYSIQISSIGCEHNSDEKIIIKRKSDKYYIYFGEKEKLLDQEEIQAIRDFEMELNYIKPLGGCTTTDTYHVKYKKKEIKVSDGSCSWNGGYFLKEKLRLTKD